MPRARMLAVFLVIYLLLPSGTAAVRAADVKANALADALITVDGDADRWGHCCLFAFGIEIGIPERALLDAWPGAKIESLPPKVLETLRQGSDGISAWFSCVNDQRPTGIRENDLFGGGSSKKAKRLTCSYAARMAVRVLFPIKARQPVAKTRAELIARMSKMTSDWEKECRGLAPGDRLRKWFDRSDVAMQRMLLALAIQTDYAPAWPLLEDSFLGRAKQPEPFLLLEISAYIRHRRKAAAKFESQVTAKLAHQPLKDETPQMKDALQFVVGLWPLLVKNDNLDGDIQDWLAGRIDLRTLSELAERSVDQPWAYHSMPVEAVAVGRPVEEANLRSLLAAAARERSLERRLPLLALAEDATHVLKHVITRTDTVSRRPLSSSDASEWKATVAHLRDLLDDQRIAIGRRAVRTPAEAAAQIVWLLWGPNTDHMATLFHGAPRDWRGIEIDGAFHSTRTLMVEAARDFLNHPEGIKPAGFPSAEAAQLAAQFTTGSAVDWRKKLDALRWDQRLLVQAQLQHDKELAVRFWPRLVELVDYQVVEPAKSSAFEALWHDNLAGRRLDATTWAALQDWIVAESRTGRWWLLIGESSPCRPGVSLYLFQPAGKPPLEPHDKRPSQADGKAPANPPGPAFESELDGRVSFFTRPERYYIKPTGLERVPPKKDDFVDQSQFPSPVEALAQQAKRTAKDNEVSTRGFSFHMVAVPGK